MWLIGEAPTWYNNASCSALPGVANAAAPLASSSAADAISTALRLVMAATSAPPRDSVNCRGTQMVSNANRL